MKLQKDYIKTFDSLKKSEGNICKAHTLKISFHLSKKIDLLNIFVLLLFIVILYLNKKRMLEVLFCFVTITYLDFQEFFLFLHELSFILRHMVTQAHSQKSGGMRTAHVMLNLTKYRIKWYRIWYHCIPLQGTT